MLTDTLKYSNITTVNIKEGLDTKRVGSSLESWKETNALFNTDLTKKKIPECENSLDKILSKNPQIINTIKRFILSECYERIDNLSGNTEKQVLRDIFNLIISRLECLQLEVRMNRAAEDHEIDTTSKITKLNCDSKKRIDDLSLNLRNNNSKSNVVNGSMYDNEIHILKSKYERIHFKPQKYTNPLTDRSINRQNRHNSTVLQDLTSKSSDYNLGNTYLEPFAQESKSFGSYALYLENKEKDQEISNFDDIEFESNKEGKQSIFEVSPTTGYKRMDSFTDSNAQKNDDIVKSIQVSPNLSLPNIDWTITDLSESLTKARSYNSNLWSQPVYIDGGYIQLELTIEERTTNKCEYSNEPHIHLLAKAYLWSTINSKLTFILYIEETRKLSYIPASNKVKETKSMDHCQTDICSLNNSDTIHLGCKYIKVDKLLDKN